MLHQTIPFQATGYFSPIVIDYLNQSERLKPFYGTYPSIENFKGIIDAKSKEPIDREVLVAELTAQYSKSKIKKAPETFENIAQLGESNTFTITTGHQLCLFTGPLYFVYKIVSIINLCKQLKAAYPEQNFVPVYWMATEDHDFAEINHFNFKNKKFQWNSGQTGAVGRFHLEGIEEVFVEFEKLLGNYNENTTYIKELFKKSYFQQSNLADATRVLVHELFKSEGLVIIDGDSAALKKAMIPAFKEELLKEVSSDCIEQTNEELAKHYKIQVNPRDINLFYIENDIRERIVKTKEGYQINDTELTFSEAEMLNLLETNPERFSPNVVLRPLYQETILPNLAYIGGGGELAYWFQLKSVFENFKVQFPALILRNSAAVLDNKQSKLYQELSISLTELFTPTVDLVKLLVQRNANHDLSITEEKEWIEKAYASLIDKAADLDETYIPHFKARLAKHLNDLDHSSKKLIRAEKRKQATLVERIERLKQDLFPNGGLQERKDNFTSIYYHYGQDFFRALYANFRLPSSDFSVFIDDQK